MKRSDSAPGLAASVSRAVTRLEELCLAGGVLTIAGVTIFNVVSRGLFDQSFAAAEELARFAIVFVTFVGLGYAAGKGRHIRMTALYDQLPTRWRRRVMLLISATTAALLFALTYLGLSYALGTVRALGSVSSALRLPLWVVYLSAPFGFALAGVQYALTFVKNLRSDQVWESFEQPETRAAAVPMDGI